MDEWLRRHLRTYRAAASAAFVCAVFEDNGGALRNQQHVDVDWRVLLSQKCCCMADMGLE